jgi:hypothetical protein
VRPVENIISLLHILSTVSPNCKIEYDSGARVLSVVSVVTSGLDWPCRPLTAYFGLLESLMESVLPDYQLKDDNGTHHDDDTGG